MSAAQILEEIRRLPREERIEVMGKVLAEQSREDFNRILRQQRLDAFDSMCAFIDSTQHSAKSLSEDEVIALSMREKLS